MQTEAATADDLLDPAPIGVTAPVPDVVDVSEVPDVSTAPAVPVAAGLRNRVLGWVLVPFALTTTAVGLGMVLVLHMLPDWGGVNPITGMLSDYGVRPEAWVFDSALDVLALGSIAAVINLARHGVLRGRWASGLMIAWCVCLVGIASFTKDPNLGAQTLRGAIHLYSTAAACVSLPVAAWVIGRAHRADPRWRGFSISCRVLAWVSVPCFLPFVISFFVIRMTHSSGPSAVPTGLVERLMGVVDVALLVLLILWSHRASRTPAPAPAA
jgi:Protein of unknown function (DUF998)